MQQRPQKRSSDSSVTSLIFPVYNAGALIDRTWREVRHFLQSAPGSWEVLFVCDGCTDGTPERLARLLSSSRSNVRIVSYERNRGKGYAVRRGLLEACGQWRIFTDVDLAYGFDDVARLANTLREGAPVAIGSRLHPESRLVVPPHLLGYALRRQVQSRVLSGLVRWLLPIALTDTQAGLKGMSAASATRLLPYLRCDGFEMDCELLTACARLGLPVTEVPVCVRYETRASTTNFLTMTRMVRALWSIRRRWRRDPAPLEKTREPAPFWKAAS
jgi:dolichyl-phosphate beta-glucosyltransferase